MAYLGIGEERDPLAGIKALLGGILPEQWPGRGGTTVSPEPGAGMTPSPVNPEAIRAFTEKVNPPGALTGNFRNLPPGDFLNMLYNPKVAAPTPALTTPTGPVAAAPPLSPEDQIRKLTGGWAETARQNNEWLAERQLLVPTGTPMTQAMYDKGMRGTQGPLPWDAFTRTPDIEGKTFVGGWTDPSGKFQPLFEPKKSMDMMGVIQPLIQQLADRAAKAAGATPSSTPAYDLNTLVNNLNTLLGAGQTERKIPFETGKMSSETARNLSDAQRMQLLQGVPVNTEGGIGTFTSQPGQPFQQIAQGSAPKITAEDQDFYHAMAMLPAVLKSASDKRLVGQSTDQEDYLASLLQTKIVARLGAGKGAVQPQTTSTTGIPSRAEWLTAAKKAPENRGRSDQELLNFYQQKYGR